MLCIRKLADFPQIVRIRINNNNSKSIEHQSCRTYTPRLTSKLEPLENFLQVLHHLKKYITPLVILRTEILSTFFIIVGEHRKYNRVDKCTLYEIRLISITTYRIYQVHLYSIMIHAWTIHEGQSHNFQYQNG